MIFTLNPNITIRRKIAYVGVMLFIGSVVVASMGNSMSASDNQLFKIASILSVGGLSLMLVPIIFGNTKDRYKRFGIAGLLAMTSVVPVVCVIMLYLIVTAIFTDAAAERYVMNNAALIFAIDIPLSVVAAFILFRIRGQSKNSLTENSH